MMVAAVDRRTLGYVLVTADPTPQLRSNLVDRDFAEAHKATGMHIVEITVPDRDDPPSPAESHPTLLVIQRSFTSPDDSQRWIASIMLAARPVTAAWAFTDRAAEEVAAAARTILRADT